MIDHPEFDNAQAHKEGWAIFDCSGSDNGRWQICKIDCPEEWNEAYPLGDPNCLPYEDAQFDSDDQVWIHVVGRAMSGSEYHRSALAYIREHNPQEWDAILKAHPEVMPRVRVQARREAAVFDVRAEAARLGITVRRGVDGLWRIIEPSDPSDAEPWDTEEEAWGNLRHALRHAA